MLEMLSITKRIYNLWYLLQPKCHMVNLKLLRPLRVWGPQGRHLPCHCTCVCCFFSPSLVSAPFQRLPRALWNDCNLQGLTPINWFYWWRGGQCQRSFNYWNKHLLKCGVFPDWNMFLYAGRMVVRAISWGHNDFTVAIKKKKKKSMWRGLLFTELT